MRPYNDLVANPHLASKELSLDKVRPARQILEMDMLHPGRLLMRCEERQLGSSLIRPQTGLAGRFVVGSA